MPYWIEKSADGSLWFNEHTGNKIAKFDPVNSTLAEYWIPTQNRLFGQCVTADDHTCGIANALQFSVGQYNNVVWFTEWTEDKIGRINAQKHLLFSVSTGTEDLTVKKDESTGSFSEKLLSLNPRLPKQVSFIFTPSADLKAGEYTLMIGAENDAVSYLKAIKINVV